jgi:hypothetical protein
VAGEKTTASLTDTVTSVAVKAMVQPASHICPMEMREAAARAGQGRDNMNVAGSRREHCSKSRSASSWVEVMRVPLRLRMVIGFRVGRLLITGASMVPKLAVATGGGRK